MLINSATVCMRCRFSIGREWTSERKASVSSREGACANDVFGAPRVVNDGALRIEGRFSLDTCPEVKPPLLDARIFILCDSLEITASKNGAMAWVKMGSGTISGYQDALISKTEKLTFSQERLEDGRDSMRV